MRASPTERARNGSKDAKHFALSECKASPAHRKHPILVRSGGTPREANFQQNTAFHWRKDRNLPPAGQQRVERAGMTSPRQRGKRRQNQKH